MTPASPLAAYTQAARAAATSVLHSYSTSMVAATRLLAPRLRPHVAAIYSLVRVADEVVDGAATGAEVAVADQRRLLDALEADTEQALRTGYSANVVVHAFATTARAAGIGAELTQPFFTSMRRDLDPSPLTAADLPDYIHGSTEAAGLMCLKVFLADDPVPAALRRRLEQGARRLGAAGQKLDFLRDLAVDWTELGRNYFPDIDPSGMTERQKLTVLADIDGDLAAAADVIPDLPVSCRRAIVAVHALFVEIAARVRATPAAELAVRRVRVPTHVKLLIAARSAVQGVQQGRPSGDREKRRP